MISDHYRAQLIQKHSDSTTWGNTGCGQLDAVCPIIKTNEGDVLDYACGKGTLMHAVQREFPLRRVVGYDPGVPMFQSRPRGKFGVVLCVDALEHIEPEHADAVLDDLVSYTAPGGVLYLLISLVSAVHLLPDGRNAHLIVENSEWWGLKLHEHGIEPHHIWETRGILAGTWTVQAKKDNQ